ncbi:MAG: hypothetical protein JSU87_08015, partial [Gemmatimonadota bacterium]
PAERDPNAVADFLKYSVRKPLTYVLIPPRALRSWFEEGVEAYNPTAEDDVEDSAWFTHRNGRYGMTPAEITRGPGGGTGPDTSGWWTVRSKLRGITPGFMIRDATGAGYLIKFDPPAYPELMSSAEAITARLLYASGYCVPEISIVYLDPSRLRVAEGATYKDARGRERPLGDTELQEILAGVPKREDGRIRAMASKLLPMILGPFDYEGTRDDDPADSIPHEHRRELRGLYVVAAWLNHLDTKQHNSMDMLVEEDGQRYVAHCLIDFGSSLGSAGIGLNTPRKGVEHDVDLGAVGARWLTAGFDSRSWERYASDSTHRVVGFYSADLFEPGDWRNNYPNPAFGNRTIRDGYWGAKLVGSFDEQQIRAAVSAGQLSDPAAEEAIVQAILARRDLTVRYWFSQVTPLESPQIEGSAQAPRLAFRDLAVAEGIAPVGRRYEVSFTFEAARIRQSGTRAPDITSAGEGALELPAPPSDPAFWERLRELPVEERLAKLEVRAILEPGVDRPRSVRFYLLPTPENGYRIVGRAY